MKKKIYNEIISLQKRLRPLTRTQEDWAYSHFDKVAYCNSRYYVWCQCCGYYEQECPEVIKISEELSHRCPKCGKVINLERKIGKSFSEKYYHTFATHIADWQVFRTFLAQRDNLRGEPTRYYLYEVFQNWVDSNGNEYILSIGYTRSPIYGERWHTSSSLSRPRTHNESYTGQYVLRDTFDIQGNYLYPRSTFLPILTRNGWKNQFLKEHRLNIVEACKALLSSSSMEMVVKTQPKLFTYLVQGRRTEVPFFHAVKICNRNGYEIKEPDMWLDYLQQLERLNLDTHNAHYVCPANLQAAHCATQKKIDKMNERKAKEEQKKDILKAEKLYERHIASFKSLFISGCGITITPLNSVQEVYDEGKAMHHCVYDNEYHKKKACLLLTARDSSGGRLETIEFSLKSMTVVQSRGKYNQPSLRHEEIKNLLINNLSIIEQCKKRKSLYQVR